MKKGAMDVSFKRGFNSTVRFLDRLGNKINFKDKSIIDIGCGLGSTCIYLASKGAKRVVGIDIDESLIEYAQSKLTEKHVEYKNIIEFKTNVQVQNEKFDIVLSKDSFEHYHNPEIFIFTMLKYLKKGGVMVIGFSPLWTSPYGGHIKKITRFPWAHLIFSESVIVNMFRKKYHKNSDYDFSPYSKLNKITLKKYLKIMSGSGLNCVYLRINKATSIFKKRLFLIFNILRIIPFLMDYLTVNIYGIYIF